MRNRDRMVGALALVGLIGFGPAVAAGQPQRPGTATAPTPGASVRVDRSQLRERAIEQLNSFTRSEDAQLRANAVEALALTGRRAAPAIAAALTDENVGVRTVAAMVVGRLKLTQIAPSVRPLLDEPSGYARAAAIFALRRCGQEVNPTALADIVLGDPDPRVRAHAAYILGELGDASALPLLKQASIEEMPLGSPIQLRLLRLQIAEAMIKLGDEAQTSVVRAALYPSRPEELEAAALAVQIIGEVKDKGAIDQLIYLSAGPKETDRPMPAEVRLAAATSMAKLGQTEGGFIAAEYAENDLAAVRAQAAAVYGHTGRNENLGRLAPMLEDASGLVRLSAAAAILRITDGSRG